MSESLGGSLSDRIFCVSLFSITNASARLSIGPLSDWAAPWLSRLSFFFIALALLSVSAFCLAFANLTSFYILTLLLGCGYGAMWVLHPIIVAELYGSKSLGALFVSFSFVGFSGVLFVSTWFAGYIYDLHCVAGSRRCVGVDCYQITFLVCSAIDFLGASAALLMAKRCSFVYNNLQQQQQMQKIDKA
jgi:MFS family permease